MACLASSRPFSPWKTNLHQYFFTRTNWNYIAWYYLQSLAVEADIPVGQSINQLEESRDDSVKSVRSHLLTDKFDQRLAASKHPAVHNVLGLFDVMLVDKVETEFLHFYFESISMLLWRMLSSNRVLTFFKTAVCVMKNLKALYHGKKTLLMISLTPSSLKRRNSARTTGELIKYKRKASAPYLSRTRVGSG